MLDEEGFKELAKSDFLHVAENTWRVLNVLSNGIQTGGVTKIAKSVIAPLAEHNVSVLMLSTYQTDYILVREDDLPVVFHTLLGDINIYKEEDGDLVPIASEESNGVKTRNSCDLTVHPVQKSRISSVSSPWIVTPCHPSPPFLRCPFLLSYILA
ncbi:unnamed protein product [Staurois parvus]|uniref:Cytosolic arginine sensor for mTORC1 subunit 1 n=1 Tax=Staurois parvus TaxID=386267 RepID=A0ABN9AMN9_9NEOB|nr:unnamed protein product [Staurois parvus]